MKQPICRTFRARSCRPCGKSLSVAWVSGACFITMKCSEKKKAQMRARMAERRKDPMFREKQRLQMAAYRLDPAWQAKIKAYRRTDDFKKKANEKSRKDRASKPQITAREKAYKSRPEVKERANELRRQRMADPVKRAKIEATRKKWESRPEVAAHLKAKSDAYCKSEGGRIARINAMSRRRARESGKTVPTPELQALFEKSAKCPYCRLKYTKKRIRSIDHFIPIAKGGVHSIENIVICCFPCNNKKRAMLPEEWAKKIGVLFV